MAPLTPTFSPSILERQIQYLPDGKRRKQAVNLKECELKELLQYNCDLKDPKNPTSKVYCEPVLRLFRK